MKKPLILFGGTDINPQLYFEEALSTTDKPDDLRDRNECLLVAYAIDVGQPIIGVCRGAQLLCALNGGKLDQHNPKHLNNNHPILTSSGDIILNVAADHHQIMQPVGHYTTYGLSFEDNLPEVIYWPATKCLAVQPHPEWMNSEHPFNIWLNKLLVSLHIDYSF